MFLFPEELCRCPRLARPCPTWRAGERWSLRRHSYCTFRTQFESLGAFSDTKVTSQSDNYFAGRCRWLFQLPCFCHWHKAEDVEGSCSLLVLHGLFNSGRCPQISWHIFLILALMRVHFNSCSLIVLGTMLWTLFFITLMKKFVMLGPFSAILAGLVIIPMLKIITITCLPRILISFQFTWVLSTPSRESTGVPVVAQWQ